MPRRFVVAIAAIAAVIVLIDVFFLVTGVHELRRERAEVLEVLQPRLNKRSETIRNLQIKSDAERKAVFESFRLMGEVYDLARKPEGIGEAHTKWGGAAEAMDRARNGTTNLHQLTDELLTLLQRQRRDARRQLNLVEHEAEVDYTKAVITAYTSMSKTHEIYKRMNVKLDDGLKLYEDLHMRTSDFLTKERSKFFRTRREAADFYTIETERGGLAEAIEKLSEELSVLEQEASASVQETSKAFGVVERNQKKLP